MAITERGVGVDQQPYVKYRNSSGERWIIRGTCNLCGECEVGGSYPEGPVTFTATPIGTAGACIDPYHADRGDVPCRPEIKANCPSCTLSGEYL